MRDFVEAIVYKARRETSGYNDDEIDDYIENNFNSVLSDLPTSVVIDWFFVFNYVLGYEQDEYSQVMTELPVSKIKLWNMYLYLEVKHAF